MPRIERSVLALLAVATAVIAVLLGLGSLPSRDEAQETGRLVPWILSWGLAWVAVGAAVAVAGFLLGSPRRPR